ncbi:gamma-butyrobetaine dioxygenase-like isoform X2 [Ptychodera flava]
MAVRNLTRWCPRISMLTQTSSRSLGAVSISQCGVQKLLRNVVYGQFIGIQQFGKRMSTGVRTFQKLTEAKANADIELNVTSEGDVLQVLWPDGQLSRFNSIWLRHNCHCSICKQEHSGQKLFENTQIDQNPTLSEVKIADGCLYVIWSGVEGHRGKIPLDWLKLNCYSENNRRRQAQERATKKLKGEIPRISYKDISSDDDSLFRWLCDINDYGVTLVTDVPAEDNQVGKVAQLIAPIQRTMYGEIFDVQSTPKPINVAYSSTKLGFHMDLVYYESPPGLQLLHCMRFDPEVTGGDSLFLDSFQVAAELREKYPKYFDTLVRVPATFQKIHFDRDWPVYMKYQRPHIILNPNKEIVCVTWAPAFEGSLQVPEDEVKGYYEAYHTFAQLLEESDLKIQQKLQPGECAVFNNRRILHARQEFNLNGGHRHLQGCYVNIDEFKSRVQVMMTMRGTGRLAKRVGNQCFL